MPPIELKPVEALRSQIECVLARELPRLRQLAPKAAIEHIGSTAIPGTLTKGDVDVVLRISAVDFPAVIVALRQAFAEAQRENWTADFASFKDDQTGPLPFGIQVVVRGTANDDFLRLRDLLRTEADARSRYNAVKQAHAGADAEAYWQAKDRLIRELLASANRSALSSPRAGATGRPE